MDDSEIVRKLKQGDADAFPIVVEKYQRLVMNCCYKFLRSRESAEDVTQEVFTEVYLSIRTFRGKSKLSTWIYRITVTKCLNNLRSRTRKKRFARLISIADAPESSEQIPSPDDARPDALLEHNERTRTLAWALGKLPQNQRTAFTLSQQEGMSYEEIASIMDSSLPSIESLIHRAKTNLRKILSNYYSEHV